MLIERKHTADLIPADYNPRKDLKPGDPEYDKLKRSMEQFGYVEPVIWNKATGRVVGGHQRLKVLMDMGVTEVECVVVEMDEEREKALNIALNKISGDWDKDKLMLLISDLQGADFDVSLTGFDPAEIDDLFKDSLKDGSRMTNSMWTPSCRSLLSPRPGMCGRWGGTGLSAGTAPSRRPSPC